MLTRKKHFSRTHNKKNFRKDRFYQTGGNLDSYFKNTIEFYQGDSDAIFTQANQNFIQLSRNIQEDLLDISGFTKPDFPPKLDFSNTGGLYERNNFLTRFAFKMP